MTLLTLLAPPVVRAAAQPLTVIDQLRVSVARHAEHLTDPSATLTFAEVSSPQHAPNFQPHDGDAFLYGLNRDTNWIRFRLADLTASVGSLQDIDAASMAADVVLYLDYPSLDYLDIYFPLTTTNTEPSATDIGGQPYLTHHSGWLQQPPAKGYQFVFPTFDVPAPIDLDGYVYIRVRSDYTRNFRIMLEDRTSFQQRQFRIIAFLFFTVGIVMAVLGTNLLLYIRLRDPQYLVYIIYIAMLLIYQNSIAGTFRLLDVRVAVWLTATVVMWSHLAMFSALRFANSFLQIRERVPRLHGFFQLLMALCTAGALLVVLGFRLEANVLAHIIGLTGPILLVSSAAMVWYKGKRHHATQQPDHHTHPADRTDRQAPCKWTDYHVSRYYLAASFLVLISVITFVLRGLGLIPHTLITSYALSLTGGAESILYSLALAERIRLLQLGQQTLRQAQLHLSAMSFTDELTGLGVESGSLCR